jgi:hypothetical protein
MLEYQHVPIKFKGMDQKTDDKNVTEGDFLSLQNVEMQKTFKLSNRRGFIKKNAAQVFSTVAAARMNDTYAVAKTDGSIYSPDVSTSADSRYACFEFDDPIGITTSENNQGYSIAVGTTNRGICITASNRDSVAISYTVTVFDLSNGTVTGTYTDKILLTTSPGISSIAASHATSGYTATINYFSGNDWHFYIFDQNGAIVRNQGVTIGPNTLLVDMVLQYTGTDHLLSIAYKNPAVGSIAVSTYTLSTNTWVGGVVVPYVSNVTTQFALNKGFNSGRLSLCWYDTVTFNIESAVINSGTFALIGVNSLANPITSGVVQKVAGWDRGTTVPGAVFTSYVARTGAIEPAFITGTKNVLGGNEIRYMTNFYCAGKPVYLGVGSSELFIQWIHVPLNVNAAGTVKGMDEYATGFITRNESVISTFGFGKYILSQGSYGRAFTQVFPCEFGISPTKINIPVGYRKKYAFGFGEIESEFKILTGVPTTKPAVTSIDRMALFNLNGCVIPFAISGVSLTGYPPNFASNLVIKTSAAGGFIAVGVYGYIAVKVATVGTKTYRGTPTAPVFVTTVGATSSNLITLNNFGSLFNITESESKNDFVEIYRTLAGGSVYYLVGVATLSYTDTALDADLAGRPILLSPSGILEASLPPLCRAATVIKNRIFAASAEELGTAVFTTVGTNSDEPRFNEVLTLSIRSAFSKIMGFAELDDKIVILCQDSLYVTYGDGPDETGGNGYPEPQLICSGIGCKYQRSIVETPDGVMFQSYDGLKLLDKSLNVQDIGAQLEDFNSYTVSAALNFTDRDQVWFLTEEGTTLVWDRYHTIWYTFTGMPTYAAFLDRDNLPVFHHRTRSYVLKESASAYNDDGITFSCVLESGNITLSGIQGFQRMRRLSWLSALTNNATVELWSNFSTVAEETITVNAVTVGAPHQFEVKPKIQKVEAKKWRITVANITGPCSFSGFAIEAGLKKGSYKKATTKRVGG